MTETVLIDDNAYRPITRFIMHTRSRLPRFAYDAAEIIALAKQAEAKVARLDDADKIGLQAEIVPGNRSEGNYITAAKVTMQRRDGGWYLIGYARKRIEAKADARFEITTPDIRKGRETDLFTRQLRAALADNIERGRDREQSAEITKPLVR